MKECPFCGESSGKIHTLGKGTIKAAWVQCTNCGACGGDTWGIGEEDREKIAVANWERRPAPVETPAVPKVKKLRRGFSV